MNFIEAIKTGRPFKRASAALKIRGYQSNTVGCPARYDSGWIDPEYFLENVELTKEDILATDWEAQPVAVPITREQFWKTWAEVKHTGNTFEHLSIVLDRLGLK